MYTVLCGALWGVQSHGLWIKFDSILLTSPFTWTEPRSSYNYHVPHEFHDTCHSVNIHCTGQFTPKMKANAEPRLLSSLVWIDSDVEVSQHRLESCFQEIKCNGKTSFMEFMISGHTANSTLWGEAPDRKFWAIGIETNGTKWETWKLINQSEGRWPQRDYNARNYSNLNSNNISVAS